MDQVIEKKDVYICSREDLSRLEKYLRAIGAGEDRYYPDGLKIETSFIRKE